jgi:hypothetical protein
VANKILLLDIETAPTIAYVWRLYDENIGVEQIVEPTRLICWSAKWLGDKNTMFAATWNDPLCLRKIHDLLSNADAVVTYNGDKFDLPKLMGEFAKEDLGNPGPLASIDLYKTVRKLGFASGKLEFVAPYLGVGNKVKHEGFRLWRQVLDGVPAAQDKMEKYNRQDTRLLEKLYKRLRPFIKNHPYLGYGKPSSCPVCASPRVQKRGTRRTRCFIIERLHCQACGHWPDGRRSKIKNV